jgi:hypothetical protein
MSKQLHQFLEKQLTPPRNQTQITAASSKNDFKES